MVGRLWHPESVSDMLEMGREEFEQLVTDALDELPAEIARLADNVVILVEDESPPGEPELLGVYDGVALTERDSSYSLQLPDRIIIFRQPLLAISPTREELVRQVAITVVHELAHHFGIDDDRLHQLGYS
jgi:predicted Zn-dependent protease with MMP-like domain